MTAETPSRDSTALDVAMGGTLRTLREERGLTARQLAQQSGISAAMVSRIENGQVSPSLSTLNALAQALDVPFVSLFRESASDRADFTHVRAGEGLVSTRVVGEHSHQFVNLAHHRRRDLQFEAHLVTLIRQSSRPPVYVGHGCVFVHALEGEAVYRHGPREVVMQAGDSISLDAELSHGFVRVITPTFTFLTVQAESR